MSKDLLVILLALLVSLCSMEHCTFSKLIVHSFRVALYATSPLILFSNDQILLHTSRLLVTLTIPELISINKNKSSLILIFKNIFFGYAVTKHITHLYYVYLIAILSLLACYNLHLYYCLM